MKKNWKYIVLAISVVMVLTACGRNEDAKSNGTDESKDKDVALIPTSAEAKNAVTVNLLNSDSDLIGTAMLSENESGLLVRVEASNLTAGEHGMHFHTAAKCDGPTFTTAGDHFNPTGANHGEHAGDLPNLVVGEDGKVQQEFVMENLTLQSGEENSLFKEGGTALVIHASADDGQTQPAGNTGDRVACGVVQR